MDSKFKFKELSENLNHMLKTRTIARVAAPVAIAEEPSTSSSSSSPISSSGAVQPRAVYQVASSLLIVGSAPHVTTPA